MTEKLNIGNKDFSRNTLFLAEQTQFSIFVVIQGNMRFGEDMFSSETILGAGIVNVYLSGRRFIDYNDVSLNIVRSN